MRVVAQVVQTRVDTWFKGDRRQERDVPVLVLLDTDDKEAMPNTFDYRLSEDEIAQLPTIPVEGGKPGEKAPDVSILRMKTLEFSFRDWKVQKGGRLLYLGRMVSPVPSGNGGATVATPPSKAAPAPKSS